MKQLLPLVVCIILMAAVIGALLSGQYAPDKISAAVSSADEQMKQAAADYAAQTARNQIVVPAQAQADATSITARTQQQIDEQAHQQALRHQGEVAALSISNTMRLNEVDASYKAALAAINIKSAREVADTQAAIEERAAATRIATVGSYALGFFLVVVGIGGAFALNRLARNRARVNVLSDDGFNQVLLIDGRVIHKTSQQLGESTIYEAPTLVERSIMLLAAAAIAVKEKSLDPLAQLRQITSVTTSSAAQATNADLLKLNNAATAGYIAAAAIKAQPAAAAQVARQSVQQASAQLSPADDDMPELIMLDNPAQRAHIEQVLEMSR